MESRLLLRPFTPEDWTALEGTPKSYPSSPAFPSRVATSPNTGWWEPHSNAQAWGVTAGTGTGMVNSFTWHKNKKRNYGAILCSFPMWNMEKISAQKTLVMAMGRMSGVLPG